MHLVCERSKTTRVNPRGNLGSNSPLALSLFNRDKEITLLIYKHKIYIYTHI